MLTILNPVYGNRFAVGLDCPLLGTVLCCTLRIELLENCM